MGRWWGVHVRLHLFFLLFAVLLAYTASVVEMQPPQGLKNWFGMICPAVLLVSVLLHEIGHVWVARHLGGVADEIVIGPLGGMAPVRVPFEPHSELVAIISGTLVNAAVCCCCAVALVVTEDSPKLAELLVSVSPFQEKLLSVADLLRLVFWVNWCLLLVNALPVFPFDGGRALHAMLGFLWPDLDSRQASLSIVRLGKIVALILLCLAWYHSQHNPPSAEMVQPPVWLSLVLLAIYVFFCSRFEEFQLADRNTSEESVFGYDFSQGYTSFDRSLDMSMQPSEQRHVAKPPSPLQFFRSWLEERRRMQTQLLREQEIEDERRVDEILAMLHEGGMNSLSAEDRALLERVSKRYRSRPTQ